MTMGEEIDRLREVRDSQALEIERLRAALSAFFAPNRAKTLDDKIMDLKRAYEQKSDGK